VALSIRLQEIAMRMPVIASAASFVLLVGSLALAGKYNPELSIGDAAPNWSALEGIDGKRHALKDLADKDVVVICFTCNTCEYAVDVEDRLVALTKKFADEGSAAALVAINPNQIEADSLEAMQERAKEQGFKFLYLHDDAKQTVTKAYGATYTPEFVVLDKNRKVVYLGALDDSPEGKDITKRYVEDAVTAALVGKAPKIAETPAIGCAVRKVRVQRNQDDED
jgi:peroxiredoxin